MYALDYWSWDTGLGILEFCDWGAVFGMTLCKTYRRRQTCSRCIAVRSRNEYRNWILQPVRTDTVPWHVYPCKPAHSSCTRPPCGVQQCIHLSHADQRTLASTITDLLSLNLASMTAAEVVRLHLCVPQMIAIVIHDAAYRVANVSARALVVLFCGVITVCGNPSAVLTNQL